MTAADKFQVAPPLSEAEFAALKADIELRGVLVPIEYDDEGNVLDGHHRIRACQELGVTAWAKIIRADLGSDRDKREHARALNLARRHLSGEAKRLVIAEQLKDTPERTDRRVAASLGVAHDTVGAVRSELERNGEIRQYEEAMEEAGVTRPGPARRKYKFVDDHDTRLVVTKHSGEIEWYTPAECIEAARLVLGAFDLDPASNDVAQKTVAAKTYFTKEMDGLSRPWSGRVWLNPPYAAGVVDKFIDKLVQHVTDGDVTAAILLVDNRTDTRWFHRAASACSRVCFTRGRLRFLRPNGDEPGTPTNGSIFLYYGPHPEIFDDVFGAIGLVMCQAEVAA